MPVTMFIVLMVLAAIVLLGVALFGIGSPDRSDQPPPHLPGHDHLDYLKNDSPED